MRKIQKLLVIGPIVTAFLTSSQITLAADVIERTEVPIEDRMTQEWTVSIDPLYGWLPGMKGDLALLGGPGISIDFTSLDLLENFDSFLDALDGYYMGAGEIRNSQFGFQWDIVYLDLGKTVSFGNRIAGAVDIGFSMTMATVAGNYRIYETQTGYADLTGGVRYTDIDIDVDLTLGRRGRSISGGDSWLDPVVGIKGRYNLSKNWYLKGSALYGGFGVSSDSLYDVAGLVGYEWANGIELYGGWRIAKSDYENGPFKWDIQLSGPLIGFSAKF